MQGTSLHQGSLYKLVWSYLNTTSFSKPSWHSMWVKNRWKPDPDFLDNPRLQICLLISCVCVLLLFRLQSFDFHDCMCVDVKERLRTSPVACQRRSERSMSSPVVYKNSIVCERRRENTAKWIIQQRWQENSWPFCRRAWLGLIRVSVSSLQFILLLFEQIIFNAALMQLLNCH